MGETAEVLARHYEISRDEQDEYALRSQERASAAVAAGRFAAEVLPLELRGSSPTRGPQTGSPAGVGAVRDGSVAGATLFTKDEHVRANTTIEDLHKLQPVFSKDGSVTAGNSSGITDGAAAVTVLSEAALKASGTEPLARIVDYEIVGVPPEVMGIGPVPAVRAVLERQELSLAEIGLIEVNEAFAAQVIACDRDLQFDPDQLNVNGGAIALGHPIGCTGVRIMTTLLHEMKKRQAKRGLATLCISGGMGIALLVERV
jgi:acetyl-CoA acetyltransferase family protein